MKISRTVLERRFFEPNDDRNGCQLNLKEIMRKLYRIIMRLCDWKLIPDRKSTRLNSSHSV